MFDGLDPHRDGGWLVAAAAFVLNLVNYGNGRGDKARQKRKDEVRAIVRDEMEGRLVRIETTLTDVKGSVDRVESWLIGGRIEIKKRDE